MHLFLVLVRHGETVYNAQGRFQGQRDTPLSPTGRDQSRLLARRLASLWGPEEPGATWPPLPGLPDVPRRVYTSDLRRAHDTARLLVTAGDDQTAATAAPPLPAPLVTPLLRERAFGSWEGLTIEEIRARFPHQPGGPPDAEPWEAVWRRMMRALDQMWRDAAGDAQEAPPRPAAAAAVALVVGHGGSLRALVCRALGVGFEQIRHLRLDNASLSLVDFAGEDLERSVGRVTLLNDTAHLQRGAAAAAPALVAAAAFEEKTAL